MSGNDENDIKIISPNLKELEWVKDDLRDNYLQDLSQKEHALNKPELRNKINLARVIDFFREEYGIAFSYEFLDKKLIVTDMSTYKQNPKNTGDSHISNLTGNIVLALDETDDQGYEEIKLVHELGHAIGRRELYYGVSTSTPDGSDQNKPNEYAKRNNLKNKGRNYFSAALDSFIQLISTIETLASEGGYKEKESLMKLLRENQIDTNQKNWVVRLMFQAKQSVEKEQLLRSVINLCCEPFSDFYDVLLLLGQSYQGSKEKEYSAFEDLENFFRFLSYKADGTDPLSRSSLINTWDRLKKSAMHG